MSGPGQSQRTGITIFGLHRMFPDIETAERWFIEQRWPDGVRCCKCGSENIQHRPSRKPQPYRCRDCRNDFSVKTDTLMHNSKLDFRMLGIRHLHDEHEPQGAGQHEAAPRTGNDAEVRVASGP